MKVKTLDKLPIPDSFERIVKTDYLNDAIWKMIDPKLFYNKLLGFKGSFIEKYNSNDEVALKLYNDIENVKDIVKKSRTPLMTPKAVYQFFYCQKKGDQVYILDNFKEKNTLETINFPRQKNKSKLCLSDYIHPEGDTIAIFACTAGDNVREKALELKDEGKFKNSYVLQALALATAEALAEVVHKEIRKLWGIGDSPNLTKDDIIKGKYNGQRYSFGYPACPNLDDQKIIWDLIDPTEIGIELTSGFMMDPEASVSAIVFHHPDAKYFAV